MNTAGSARRTAVSVRRSGSGTGCWPGFLIGYDMTFLALLSLSPETAIEQRRCVVHPLRKQPWHLRHDGAFRRRRLHGHPRLSKNAGRCRRRKGLSVDTRPTCSPVSCEACCRKAAARQPKFDENVRQCLSQLAAVEERGSASLDEAADCFARLMAFPAYRLADEMQRRLQSEILYHVGRAVYILDAADDYSDDRKNGRYNPLCLRFGSEVMTAEEKAEIRATLNLSLSRAMSARRSCRRARGRPSSKTSYPAVFRMLPMRCLPEHGRKTEKIRRISDPSDRE